MPTLNERDNIRPLIARDRNGAARHPLGNHLRRRRFPRRHRRPDARDRARATRGCAACSASAGAASPPPASRASLASAAPFVAVMDADLQHDERLLPQMLATLQDRALRSRRRQPLCRRRRHRRLGQAARPDQRPRDAAVAARSARPTIADPMSGFFMLRRDAFERAVRRPVRPGLQDPARSAGLVAGAAARSRNCPYHSGRGSMARASSTRWSPGNSACCSPTS